METPKIIYMTGVITGNADVPEGGWLDVVTADGKLRLQMSDDALLQLPYAALPLANQVESRSLDLGNIQTYKVEDIDVFADDSEPKAFVVRVRLGGQATMVFEMTPELATELSDAIRELK